MDAAEAAMKRKIITEDVVETIPTMHVQMNMFACRLQKQFSTNDAQKIVEAILTEQVRL